MTHSVFCWMKLKMTAQMAGGAKPSDKDANEDIQNENVTTPDNERSGRSVAAALLWRYSIKIISVFVCGLFTVSNRKLQWQWKFHLCIVSSAHNESSPCCVKLLFRFELKRSFFLRFFNNTKMVYLHKVMAGFEFAIIVKEKIALRQRFNCRIKFVKARWQSEVRLWRQYLYRRTFL